MSSPRIPLIVVTALDPSQFKEPVLKAPPVFVASEHSVDYTCGRCGTTLLHAEEGQVRGLAIECTECGSYNRTPS
jgi:DNA-directed RNA polymerase subunit RPC12/RpoP